LGTSPDSKPEKKLLKLCLEKNERQRQKEFRVLKKLVVKTKIKLK